MLSFMSDLTSGLGSKLFEPVFAGIFLDEISYSSLITQLISFVACIILMFLLNKRFFKIAFACGAEVSLWLACKTVFGKESIITQIFTWFTAAAAIILVIAIVNRINWSGLRKD